MLVKASKLFERIREIWEEKENLRFSVFASLSLVTIAALIIIMVVIARPKVTLTPAAGADLEFNTNSEPTFILDSGNFIKSSADKKERVLGAKSGQGILIIGGKTIFAELIHQKKLTEIKPTIDPIENETNKFKIKIPPTPQFAPGKYILRVTIDNSGQTKTIEQNFSWGVLAINPDQDVYASGSEAFISMAVLDDEGKMVCDADLTLQIQAPNSQITRLSSKNGEIKTNPECQKHKYAEKPDYQTAYQVSEPGRYQMLLTAKTENGTKKLEDRFFVEENPQFIIKRTSATRIYPPDKYKMALEIFSRNNFSGPIKEKVPASFKIETQKGLEIEKKDNIQILTWKEKIAAGKKIKLSYVYKAPEISPQFYLTGPLEIGSKNIEPIKEKENPNKETFQETTAKPEKKTDEILDENSQEIDLEENKTTTKEPQKETESTSQEGLVFGEKDTGAGSIYYQEKRQWQIAADAPGVGAIGIWRDSAGAQIPGTSFSAFNFATQERNDGAYTFSGSNNCNLDEAGNYLFIATLSIDDDSNGRVNYEGRFTYSGSGKFVTLYGSGYSRNNNNDHAWVRVIGLVWGASINDDVQLEVRRDSDAPTNGSIANASHFQVVRLQDSAAVGMYTDTSDTGGYDTQTWTDAPFNNVVLENDTSVIEKQSGNNDIRLKKSSATFLVGYGLSFDIGNGNRTQRITKMVAGSSSIEQSFSYTYMRNTANQYGDPNALFLYRNSGTSTDLSVQAQRGNAEGNATSTARRTNASGFFVVELPSSAETFISHDSTGNQDIGGTNGDFNAAESVDYNDSAAFTKVNNTTINAEKAMDVLLIGQTYVERSGTSGTRMTTGCRFEIQGSDQTVGEHGYYLRGNESGGSRNYTYNYACHPAGMYGVSSDDDMQFEWFDEGDNGSTDYTIANTVGLSALNLDSLESVAPEITVGTSGSQTSTMNIPSTNNYVGGAFTFVRDSGTTNVTQIVVSESGTVNANANLSNLDLYYETAATCSYEGTETLFGTAASFDTSENATVSGTMSVGTSQVCVYAVVDVGSGAGNNDTLDLEITNPSTEVTVSAGTVTPATPVAISGTTTLSGNQNPNNPSALAQKKTDDTVLTTGDWTNETSVKFTATVSDPDSDQVQLCVEKDPLGTGFSGTEDLCGSLVNSGQTASVTITSQTDDTEYHWQARTKDSNGAYSSWVSYGGNGEGERDYGIDTSAPTGGTVNDGAGADQDWNDGTLDSISANWNSFDATVSGLNKYEYAMRRESDNYYWNEGSSIWQSGEIWYDNGTSTSKTVNGINLQTGETYYCSVKVTDNAGNTTSPVNSDGQQVLPELSFALNSNQVTFDNLNGGNSWTNTKTTTITTSTNAYYGYSTTAYITDYLRSIPYASNYIDDFQGTYSTPETWEPGEYGFGYTTSDTDVNSGKFVGSKYAAFSHTALGDSLADHTAYVTGQTGKVTSEQFTITYKVATQNIQIASPYQVFVAYTCTANF